MIDFFCKIMAARNFCSERESALNPSGTKGGGGKRTPLGFSSVVFARGMILKRNFG